MVATVEVEIWKGGSAGSPGTETVVSQIRFRTDDNPDTINDTNPIPIPPSGYYYSFWVHLCLKISGTFTKVNNIRHYSAGAGNPPNNWTFGTDGEVRRGNRDSGDQGCPKTSYDPASGTVGTTGDELGANHSYYSGQTTKTANIESDTEASPALIDSDDHTSAEDSKAVVLQVLLDDDGTQGSQTSATLYWKYDEI